MSDAPIDETVTALERLPGEMDRALERAREVLAESTSTWAKSATVLARHGVDVPQPTPWPREPAPAKQKRKLRMAI